MQHFDFVIAGGGAAGLSLAYYLMLSPLRNRQILIVDKDDEDQLQRNWGYWADQPTPFDSLAHHCWGQLDFVSDGFQRRIDLGRYHYRLMHGATFYPWILEQLAACPNVSFVRNVVRAVEDGDDAARVQVNGDTYTADWVFDSVIRPAELKRELARYQFLRMQFKGVEIETPCLAFDPRAARLFDFRTPQRGAMRFFYMMPFSECRAFVEYTAFAADVLKQDEYDRAIKEYIEDTLGIRDYQVVSEENGAVPLTDYPFPRRAGRHVMTVGAKAGRVKASTGYSFTRVQKDGAAIVQSLLRHGHPFDVPADSPWFRLADSIMLNMMRRHGEEIGPIFAAMFTRNPIERVFRFLDETATPAEVTALIATLPPWRFMEALARMKVFGRL
jgi:lycopene beta-cyclase